MKKLTLGLSLLLVIALAACGETGGGDGDPGAPAAPTLFEASAASPTSVRLSWAAVQDAESYNLERKSGAGAYQEIATPGAADTSYTDTGLSPATEYSYRLSSANAQGSSAGVEATVTTPGLGGGSYTKLGVVTLGEASAAGTSFRTATASFTGFDQPIGEPGNPFGQAEDTCFVFVFEEDAPPPPPPTPGDDPDPVSLDAGDPLTVEADGATYATLERQISGDTVFYQSPPTSPLGPLPASATVDIPGAADGFPAFSGAAFPGIPADFTLSATPSLDAVTTDSGFSWTGSGTSDSVMYLSGTGQNSEDEAVYFSCIAEDDGNFVFPAQAQAELSSSGFTTGAVNSALRTASSSRTQGDAVLLLSVSRSKTYGLP